MPDRSRPTPPARPRSLVWERRAWQSAASERRRPEAANTWLPRTYLVPSDCLSTIPTRDRPTICPSRREYPASDAATRSVTPPRLALPPTTRPLTGGPRCVTVVLASVRRNRLRPVGVRRKLGEKVQVDRHHLLMPRSFGRHHNC